MGGREGGSERKEKGGISNSDCGGDVCESIAFKLSASASTASWVRTLTAAAHRTATAGGTCASISSSTMKMMGITVIMIITVTMIITVITMMISNDNTRERRGPQGCVSARQSTRCQHLLREREGEGESESERVRERERVLVCRRSGRPGVSTPGGIRAIRCL